MPINKKTKPRRGERLVTGPHPLESVEPRRGETRATMPYIPNSAKFISAITNYHKTSQNLIYRKDEQPIESCQSTKNKNLVEVTRL